MSALLIMLALPALVSAIAAGVAAGTGRGALARQILIAWDQGLNVLVWAAGEGWGSADETLSARAWRLRDRRTWGALRWLLDHIFWRDTDGRGARAHCYLSWLAEFERRHLHESYRTGPVAGE